MVRAFFVWVRNGAAGPGGPAAQAVAARFRHGVGTYRLNTKCSASAGLLLSSFITAAVAS